MVITMGEINQLDGVEATLYIPLVSRIYVSKRFPDYFYDKRAISLAPYLPVQSIEENSSEYMCFASASRQFVIDQKILKFLRENPFGNVIFLGAGLETAFDRLENERANFYQVDLPSVIAIREKLLGEGKNERLIAKDMFTLDWAKEVDSTLPTMIVVSGVYQYFSKERVVTMVKKMRALFLKGELVFDVTNAAGLKVANKYVEKTGNKNAKMYFSVEEPLDFANETQTTLLGVEGFFKEALKTCKGLKFTTKVLMYLADKLKRTKIIHLHL